MGRHAEGWKLRWKTGLAYVRFSLQDPVTGKTIRPEVPTGERDAGRAASRAAQIYADAVAGRLAVTPSARVSSSELAPLVAAWLVQLQRTYPANTFKCYREYSLKWLRAWSTLGEITEAAVAEFTRQGLERATTKTMRKELSALLGNFFVWAIEQEHVAVAPPRPVALLRKSKGTSTGTQRKHRVEITPAQMAKFLAAVPEWGGKGDRRWRARDACIVMYETGLRPQATVGCISVPEHWRPGATDLAISDAIDKAKFGRRVPLTRKAIDALERSAPVQGVVFGRHDYRDVFARAREEAPGTPAGLSVYDIRHARGQHLVDAGAPITGVAYLLGHTRLTTTNIYVRASQKEASRALLFGEIVGKSEKPIRPRRKSCAKTGT